MNNIFLMIFWWGTEAGGADEWLQRYSQYRFLPATIPFLVGPFEETEVIP